MLSRRGLRRTVASAFSYRRLSSSNLAAPYFSVHDEVRSALAEGRPVVALESTIISHGMPWPDNAKCALDVEKQVRDNGAVPATIAIMEGKVHVGLEPSQLERLAKAGASAVRKVSRRDFASTIASGGIGATTVAGTMIAAHAAGIYVFATGGIGGVHRDGQSTMDVSADLTELGRTPVAVVCAGVKSILDIPRTIEYLETQGVPVASFRTDEFPAFYSTRSGVRSPERYDHPSAVARSLAASIRLGLANGSVLAVPNPSPAEGEVVDAAIHTALREAEAAGVSGWRLTPFLLERVAALTGGESLRANVALVMNNAAVGAQVAVELAALLRETPREGPAQAGHGHRHEGAEHAPGAVRSANVDPALASSQPSVGVPRQGASTGARAGHGQVLTGPGLGAGAGEQRRHFSSPSQICEYYDGACACISFWPAHATPGSPLFHLTVPQILPPSPSSAVVRRALAAGTATNTSYVKSHPRATMPSRSFSTAPADAPGGGDSDEVQLTPEQEAQLMRLVAQAEAQHAATQATGFHPHHPTLRMLAGPSPQRRPVVVGGAVVDLLMRPTTAGAGGLRLRTSNPGTVRQSFGGVGRNIAEVIARLAGTSDGATGAAEAEVGAVDAPLLFTAVGPEPHGAALQEFCGRSNIELVNVAAPRGGGDALSGSAASGGSVPESPHVHSPRAVRTATYAAMLDGDGSLVGAIADMSAFDALTPQALGLGLTGASDVAKISLLELMASDPPPLIVIDGNVPAATTAAIAEAAAAPGATVSSGSGTTDCGPAVLFEPTSTAKCVRGLDSLHLLTIVKPNRHEVLAMAAEWRARMGLQQPEELPEEVEDEGAVPAGKPPGGKGGKGAGGSKTKNKSRGGESAVSHVVTIGGDDGRKGPGSLVARETRALGAAGGSGESVTFSAYEGSSDAAAMDEEGDDDAVDADSALDYSVLTAAQTVLAGMVRPSGLATPFSPGALEHAEGTLRRLARTADAPAGGVSDKEAPASGFAAALGKASTMQAAAGMPSGGREAKNAPSAQSSASAAPATPAALHHMPLTTARGPGATIDGRKHVLVSLGRTGVMWLSAPPAADNATADLLATLPFFSACQHPTLALDFKLCPAPEPGTPVVKVTGAGDSFVGTLAWALCGGQPLPRAIELGLSASCIAVTSDITDGASTVAPGLMAPAVEAGADTLVRPVDRDYA